MGGTWSGGAWPWKEQRLWSRWGRPWARWGLAPASQASQASQASGQGRPAAKPVHTVSASARISVILMVCGSERNVFYSRV